MLEVKPICRYCHESPRPDGKPCPTARPPSMHGCEALPEYEQHAQLCEEMADEQEGIAARHRARTALHQEYMGRAILLRKAARNIRGDRRAFPRPAHIRARPTDLRVCYVLLRAAQMLEREEDFRWPQYEVRAALNEVSRFDDELRVAVIDALIDRFGPAWTEWFKEPERTREEVIAALLGMVGWRKYGLDTWGDDIYVVNAAGKSDYVAWRGHGESLISVGKSFASVPAAALACESNRAEALSG